LDILIRRFSGGSQGQRGAGAATCQHRTPARIKTARVIKARRAAGLSPHGGDTVISGMSVRGQLGLQGFGFGHQ
jgi:hypothetical protein